MIIMKIKVLHVLGSLGVGGMETLLLNIYKNIDRKKYQFDIVIHNPELVDYQKTFEELGSKVFVCPRYKVINHNQYKNWWESFLKETHYDIVHGHCTTTSSIYLKIAKKYDIRTISHIHNDSYGSGLSAVVKNVMQKGTSEYADKLIGCSKQANEFIYGKKLVEEGKCSVFKNGFDVDKYKFDNKDRKAIRKQFNTPENQIVLGTVGRITALKNPGFIIDILKELLGKSIDFKFLWLGKGDQDKALESLIHKNNLQNKILRIPHTNEVEKYLSVMDAFLFPSKKEGLGIALLEAQANGLTCFTSENIPDEAVVTDLVHKLSLGKDAKYWVEFILRTKLSTDRAKYNKQVKQSGYDIKDVTEELTTIYAGLLK